MLRILLERRQPQAHNPGTRQRLGMYLGCDWQNAPLHLPHTFKALDRLVNSPHVRVAMLGEHGLTPTISDARGRCQSNAGE